MLHNLQNIQNETSDFFERSDICLFELSDEGTVLYCRASVPPYLSGAGEKGDNPLQAVGHNFFDEVPPFENAGELRPLLNRFVKNDAPTEKFTFPCRTRTRVVTAKIMLVRLSGQSDGERAQTTIVDIRKI